MNKLTIEEIEPSGKAVFVRVDFNVPLANGEVGDDTRIASALPTIQNLVERGARVVLASHLGRPAGKPVEDLKMDPVAKRLGRLLGKAVRKLDDCVGADVEAAIAEMMPGDVVLLENLRFHKEETDNDEQFARALAAPVDMYVNDAFGTAHRAHASTEGITKFVEPCAAGFLMGKEIEYFSTVLTAPATPFVTILGGAKVSDKIGTIDNLMDVTDKFLVGGGMAYTFLKAQGCEIGESLCEDDKMDVAREAIEKAKRLGKPFVLPVDNVIARQLSEDAETRISEGKDVDPGWMGLDIGPKTIELFCDELAGAETVVWNGPVGAFEVKSFEEGTRSVANCVAESSAISVIGGGDTAAAVAQFGLSDRMSHISTGGGASLEILEGKKLPGIEALTDR
jgi:phosphoglycerate kinase